jgi:hypothetical protein
MSFSIYVNSSDKNPSDQINDLMTNFILNYNTRVILGFANFNITDSDSESIPGIDNMTDSDIINLVKVVQNDNIKSKISLSIGGPNHFANSELYANPEQLANNINKLLLKYKFSGVDFNIQEINVPYDFVKNLSLLINTLRSINNGLNITLTITTQGWDLNLNKFYQIELINSTIHNINALQTMEYDMLIDGDNTYAQQIIKDIDFYIHNWLVQTNKLIVILKPGIDNTLIDNNKHNLLIPDALFVANAVKSIQCNGICIWSSYIDSKGCDGNDPNEYSVEIKTILELYPPGPPHPLPPNPPTSPKLTKDEISKIKVNVSRIIDYNQKTYDEQKFVINDVINTLKIAVSNPPADPQSDTWKIWVDLGIDVICIILPEVGVPAKVAMSAEIGLSIFKSTLDYLTENSKSFKDNPELQLDVDQTYLSERNKYTCDAIHKYCSFMYDDPQTYRDQDFKYKDKSYTLRDLIDIDIPDPNSTVFFSMVQQNGRQFRNLITVSEMAKIKIWNIYNICDGAVDPDHGIDQDVPFGWIFNPITYKVYNKRIRGINKGDVGKGARIFANDEIWHFHPDYAHVEAFGNSDDDLVGSFLYAGNQFINSDSNKDDDKKKPSQHAGLVYPWIVCDKYILSQRWYITNGPVETTSAKYALADGDFMKWLFIDDGFGNVINPNGAMYRYDILRNGLLDNAKDIPENIPYDGPIQFQSSDNQYKYPGCSDLSSDNYNKIYTDDFYTYSKLGEGESAEEGEEEVEEESIFKIILKYVCRMCCKRKSE